MSASAPKPALEHPLAIERPFVLRHLGRAAAQLGLAIALDAALLALGLGAAVGLRTLADNTAVGPLRFGADAVHLYLLCVLCWVVMLLYENLYRRDLQSADQGDQLMKALTAGLVAAILLSFALHRSGDLSRSVVVLWYGCNLLLFTLLRPLLQKWTVKRPLVLVVADDSTSAEPACIALRKLGFSARAMLAGAPTPGGDGTIGAVVLCLAPGSEARASVAHWERTVPEVAIFAGGSAVTPLGARPVNLHGVQLFALRHPLDQPVNRACKRCLDIVGATVLLAAFSPVLLALMLAVRLESPGPAFYRQRRLGRHGRPFSIVKFRSMRRDAEACLQELLAHDDQAHREFSVTFKLKNDPRITRVGRLLRRYSLDELPQFWNVLRGEMSLVGPRPIVDAEVPLYEDAYPIVASVCPGMTGMWQTSGRSDVSYESRRGFDLAYVRGWSLWRDVSILLRTVAAVVLPNAY